MFRIISIISFVVVLVILAVHNIACAPGERRKWRPIEFVTKLLRLLMPPLLKQRLSVLGILKKLIYLLALLCFVVLLITGFGPRLILGKSLSGYWVMAHVTFAPVFALCVAALAVMWAHRCRFDKSDYQALLHLIQRHTQKDALCEISELIRKICFWLICVLAVPLILSIVLSMFPLFGTAGQKFLFHLHRYSALLFALAAIVHTYLVIRIQVRKQ